MNSSLFVKTDTKSDNNSEIYEFSNCELYSQKVIHEIMRIIKRSKQKMENKKTTKSLFLKPKKHSKSDAFALDLNHIDDNVFNKSKSHQDRMNELAEKNNELTKSLQEALQKNKELKAELKRKLDLEAKLEDQKNTTKELKLLTSLCNVEVVEAATK